MMRFRETSDPFKDKQPAFQGLSALAAPYYGTLPEDFGRREPEKDEISFRGSVLLREFPDEKGRLETVYQDFETFSTLFLQGDRNYAVHTVKTDMEEEAFRLSVSETECIIYAGDTEGVRRALYFMEDEMVRRGGPFLPTGTIERKPQVKRRITRNFFTPHEANLELKSETDFYPDGYLSRLAHEGVNGLWIFLRLGTLVPSRIVPQYGQGSEKMLEKLKQIAEKCARYGIRVYGLGVEPYSTHNNEFLKEKHADMLGSSIWGGSQKVVCPSSEKGRAYIEECMYTLFTLVPGLAGFIGITLGEAVAGCGSVATTDPILCPHCKKAGRTKPEALAETERLLVRGMKKAKPDAEFISWTYAMRGWTPQMQAEHGAARDATIPLMNNFEDRGTALQLGKERSTVDYWLSFIGPGAIFKNGAENAHGAPLYAKLQVCASHELATVPYVPVPGILYDKFHAMHEMGVTGAMYCWFFGNYPSLMNRAAGELSFLDFTGTKEAFIETLATLYTKKEDAPTLCKAWECFEKSYALCPYNVAFAWFGPLNDAPVRPLHLLPVDVAVPSNWLLCDTPEGDRFGEWCGMTHTPEEVNRLLCDMKTHWQEGMAFLSGISVPEEMRQVANAISILIQSAENLFVFYLLRNQLGYGEENGETILAKMEAIARREIENSERLAALCEKDTRLGYHSEAVGYKFFPEKLRWRIGRIEEMLAMEFPQVSQRMAEGKAPLAFFEGEGNYVYPLAESPWETFLFLDGTDDTETKIRVSKTDAAFCIELRAMHDDPIIIHAEFRLFCPYVPVCITKDGTVEIMDEVGYYVSKKQKAEEEKKWQVSRKNGILKVVLSKKAFGLCDGKAFRLGVRRGGENPSSWKRADRVFPRLMYDGISPDEKVFIL